MEMVHDRSFGEASNNRSNKLFWKTIWRLNVPNKVKSFAWRASNNIISTKANLCHRKVIDNPTYEACSLGAKSSGHVLWDYEKTQEIWKLSGIPFEFRQRMGDDLLELVIMVAWYLWFNRNEVRLDKARLLGVAILQKAQYMLDELQNANLKLSQTSPNTSSIGVGTIIQDHDGQVEATLSKALLVPLGPLEAKAKALEESILFAWDVGVQDVIFESDSKIVCDAITGCSEPLSAISTLIEGTRLKLQDFRRSRVSHILRQCNCLAHLLAQYARHVVGYVTWIEETPYIVESVVTYDIMLLSLS
ncbi:uncharacterized protein LOC126690220 [Quercus robur]|uniref:uncharacterized protein LOC126690220 n=1 Tax=Quercus robur TaxID=38942 RepID=UPI002161FD57|nr:uncharacterized protein LOC126690220 [Quercus robur]